MVEGDRELLAQALGNLLDNAIDFTPSQGILLGRKSVMAACC
jgi:two-component system sensor histidine kinase CreC